MNINSYDMYMYEQDQCIMFRFLCKYRKRPGPNFMAMLTVSKESVLTEAGNTVLNNCTCISPVSGGFWLLCDRTYKASTEIRRLQVGGEW